MNDASHSFIQGDSMLSVQMRIEQLLAMLPPSEDRKFGDACAPWCAASRSPLSPLVAGRRTWLASEKISEMELTSTSENSSKIKMPIRFAMLAMSAHGASG